MPEARAPGPDDRPQHPAVPAAPAVCAVQPLPYAQPSAGRPPWLPFRATAGLFAALGVFANCFFVERAIAAVHEAHLAHFRLDRFSRAFGREIDAEVVASLARPVGLWASSAAVGAAAVAGLLFAVRLLIAIIRLDRDEQTSLARLEHYATWKPLAAVMTALAYFWWASEQHGFWVAATRHVPIGSDPPVLWALVLFACAFFPAWWIERRLKQTTRS